MRAPISPTARRVFTAALLAATVGLLPQAALAQQPPPVLSYVFKPKDLGYTAPMKPVTHIADIIAAHRGQSDWEHPVVKDPWFFIQYIQMAPGKKTPVSMQSDTIIWFIINSGQVRFTFKGHDPIVAGVDSMVSIPARTPYAIETVGDAPSIRFEVRNAHAGTVFPVADNATPPRPPPGYETVTVNCTCNEAALKGAKPKFFDYGAWARANPTTTQRPPFPDGDTWFVRDANGFMTMNRSAGVPMPPPGVIGHFHMGLAEWWYALEGDMATRIEGVGDVFAKHGDIIYAPRGAYHQTVMTGLPYSTRTPAGKTGVNDSGASFSKPAPNP
jgi:mannose-6-phosphate isomerase-like protein (cupin superfamily)